MIYKIKANTNPYKKDHTSNGKSNAGKAAFFSLILLIHIAINVCD